jgi:hypothetical protein
LFVEGLPVFGQGMCSKESSFMSFFF